MDFIQLPSQTEAKSLFGMTSITGDDLGEPNPLITGYVIDVQPLATSKQILFDELWQRLDCAPLLNSVAVSGKSQAARDVQRICKMGHSELLADKVATKVAQVIHKLISKVHLIADETPITEYLTEFRDFWMNLCNQMQTYRDVFYYLERTYLLRERNQSLWQLALSLVKTKITEDAKHKLCEGVL